MMRPKRARRVCVECGDVAMVAGTPGLKVIRRCRSCAQRINVARSHVRGPLPRDDIDDVVVERLVLGHEVAPGERATTYGTRGNVGERIEATRRLTRAGATLKEIAEKIGVCERAVARYRTELYRTGQLSHVAVDCATRGNGRLT